MVLINIIFGHTCVFNISWMRAYSVKYIWYVVVAECAICVRAVKTRCDFLKKCFLLLNRDSVIKPACRIPEELLTHLCIA